MKFQIIDKDKKGFARYCPTFAKAYECIIEGIKTKIRRKNASVSSSCGRGKKLWDTTVEEEGRQYAPLVLILEMKKRDRVGRRYCLNSDAVDALGYAAAVKDNSDVRAALYEKLGIRDPIIREGVIKALGHAAIYGADITEAIPEMLNCLWDENSSLRQDTLQTLFFLMTTRSETVRGVMGFMGSTRFQKEMEKNSIAYERAVIEIARLLYAIKISESHEAA